MANRIMGLAAPNVLLANTDKNWDDLQSPILNSGGAAQQMQILSWIIFRDS